MKSYKALKTQIYKFDKFSIIPIRFDDIFLIKNWRNQQIYHLRQNNLLTNDDQIHYFEKQIIQLFDQEKPCQVLFSLLEDELCIGYGGLVHINWIDRHAEISFIMNTTLETLRFDELWTVFLKLIEEVAFNELKLHKIYTYAFDVRPRLYEVLLKSKYHEDARLKEHCLFNENYIDVLIHSKINNSITLRIANETDVNITFEWASNKVVRKYAINKGDILFQEHRNWFTKKINSEDCVYFIAELNEIAIGSIRFDLKDNTDALLSYLIEPRYHGKGFGKQILAKGCDELKKLKKVKKIIGIVNIDNIPSVKTFLSLGFSEMQGLDSYISFYKNV